MKNITDVFFFSNCYSSVVAADGFTYERSAIQAWLQHNDHSPMTNEKLAHTNLNENILIKNLLATISQ